MQLLCIVGFFRQQAGHQDWRTQGIYSSPMLTGAMWPHTREDMFLRNYGLNNNAAGSEQTDQIHYNSAAAANTYNPWANLQPGT